MTVQSRKEEILRLIRRVSSPEAAAAPAQASPAPSRSLPRRGPAPRGARGIDLEAIRQRRRRIEEKLVGSAPLQVLRDLEQRLAAIEARLGPRSEEGAQAAPSPPEAVLPPSTAAAAPPPSGEDDVLSGRIGEGVLADILQMLSSNLATGLFVVRGADGQELRLFFEEGQIVHAEGVGLSGESALFAAMAVEQGRFSFRENGGGAPEKTIGSKTQFLILEALRQIDEARAGGARNE